MWPLPATKIHPFSDNIPAHKFGRQLSVAKCKQNIITRQIRQKHLKLRNACGELCINFSFICVLVILQTDRSNHVHLRVLLLSPFLRDTGVWDHKAKLLHEKNYFKKWTDDQIGRTNDSICNLVNKYKGNINIKKYTICRHVTFSLNITLTKQVTVNNWLFFQFVPIHT